MRKYLSMILLSMMGFMFQSCDKSDDDNVNDDSFTLARVSYNFSEDLLSYCNVEMTITDYEGNTETFNVTESGENKYEMISKADSGRAVVDINYTLKEELPAIDSLSVLDCKCYVLPFTCKTKDGSTYALVHSKFLTKWEKTYGITEIESLLYTINTMKPQRIIYTFNKEKQNPTYSVEDIVSTEE